MMRSRVISDGRLIARIFKLPFEIQNRRSAPPAQSPDAAASRRGISIDHA
jgi:hypothetical protein